MAETSQACRTGRITDPNRILYTFKTVNHNKFTSSVGVHYYFRNSTIQFISLPRILCIFFLLRECSKQRKYINTISRSCKNMGLFTGHVFTSSTWMKMIKMEVFYIMSWCMKMRIVRVWVRQIVGSVLLIYTIIRG